MAATLIADLNAPIERFEEAIRDQGMSRSQLVAARAATQASLQAGFQAIRQLDVIVSNQLAANPVALTALRKSKRIGKAPAPRRGAADAEPDTAEAVSPPPIPPAVTVN